MQSDWPLGSLVDVHKVVPATGGTYVRIATYDAADRQISVTPSGDSPTSYVYERRKTPRPEGLAIPIRSALARALQTTP